VRSVDINGMELGGGGFRESRGKAVAGGEGARRRCRCINAHSWRGEGRARGAGATGEARCGHGRRRGGGRRWKTHLTGGSHLSVIGERGRWSGPTGGGPEGKMGRKNENGPRK
jgi:hypothetical protein